MKQNQFNYIATYYVSLSNIQIRNCLILLFTRLLVLKYIFVIVLRHVSNLEDNLSKLGKGNSPYMIKQSH